MKDIATRLREINDSSLIMDVIRDCLDAAEEIDQLRLRCDSHLLALTTIKKIAIQEEEKPAGDPGGATPLRALKTVKKIAIQEEEKSAKK